MANIQAVIVTCSAVALEALPRLEVSLETKIGLPCSRLGLARFFFLPRLGLGVPALHLSWSRLLSRPELFLPRLGLGVPVLIFVLSRLLSRPEFVLPCLGLDYETMQRQHSIISSGLRIEPIYITLNSCLNC